jgi:hypothetical protein
MPAKIVGAQEKAGGRREDPGDEDVPECTFLQARLVSKHGSGEPEVRTCVVLTGRPKLSARKMVPIVVSSAAAPCAYAK